MPKVHKKYKFAVIATDIVLLTVVQNRLKVLLIKMKKSPFTGMWACPGGLVKPNESVDDAAERILKSEAGVAGIYLEQLYTFGKVDRDPFGRVVSVSYFALVPNAHIHIQTTAEYADIAWFDVNHLPKLGYDHGEIIAKALHRVQTKLRYSNIIFALLPNEFTLVELQKLYEIILSRKFDKRNFRKKIMLTKLIKKLNKKRHTGPSRPAMLYSFALRKPQTVEMF